MSEKKTMSETNFWCVAKDEATDDWKADNPGYGGLDGDGWCPMLDENSCKDHPHCTFGEAVYEPYNWETPRTYPGEDSDNYWKYCNFGASHGWCENAAFKDACRSECPCADGEFLSELGMCVPKPWSDFTSCAEEKLQGACKSGTDPNPWVGQHCQVTCAT